MRLLNTVFAGLQCNAYRCNLQYRVFPYRWHCNNDIQLSRICGSQAGVRKLDVHGRPFHLPLISRDLLPLEVFCMCSRKAITNRRCRRTCQNRTEIATCCNPVGTFNEFCYRLGTLVNRLRALNTCAQKFMCVYMYFSLLCVTVIVM
jgi:hypothetical protein